MTTASKAVCGREEDPAARITDAVMALSWTRAAIHGSPLDRVAAQAGRRAQVMEVVSAALASTAGAGAGDWVTVPRDAPEAMWGGLARQIVMWCRFGQPTGKALFQHLKSSGYEIPAWLREEVEDVDHVPPKGTVAVIIYRAMIEAAPAVPASPRAGAGEGEEGQHDDQIEDERWNAGLDARIDYAMTQLCAVLGVDRQKVVWDAATETLDGDVRAVLCNILSVWAGENWRDVMPATPPAPAEHGVEIRELHAALSKGHALLCESGPDRCWVKIGFGWLQDAQNAHGALARFIKAFPDQSPETEQDDDDREIERILGLSGDEIHAELVAEGHDPDQLLRAQKTGLDGLLRLAADRQRWRGEAASWRRVAERLEGEKQALVGDDLRSRLKPCPEEANEALCCFPSCTCAADRLHYEPRRAKALAWLVSNGEAGDDLRYRMWSGRAWVWTPSLAQAAHFARRQDARQILPDGAEHGQDVVPAAPAQSPSTSDAEG